MGNMFANLTGTTSDVYTIGKRGPTIARGDGVPTVNTWPLNNGSIFISSVGDVYKRSANSWVQLVTVDMIPVTSYHTTVIQSQLDGNGMVVVNHNLNQKYVNAAFYDTNTDLSINPDAIKALNANSIQIDLHSFEAEGMSIQVCVNI